MYPIGILNQWAFSVHKPVPREARLLVSIARSFMFSIRKPDSYVEREIPTPGQYLLEVMTLRSELAVTIYQGRCVTAPQYPKIFSYYQEADRQSPQEVLLKLSPSTYKKTNLHYVLLFVLGVCGSILSVR